MFQKPGAVLQLETYNFEDYEIQLKAKKNQSFYIFSLFYVTSQQKMMVET